MTPTLIILLILAFTFAAGVLIGEAKNNDDLTLWSSGLLVIVVLAAIVLFVIEYL